MGWREQDNRDQDEAREWRKRPLQERYDWVSTLIFVALLATFIFALRSR